MIIVYDTFLIGQHHPLTIQSQSDSWVNSTSRFYYLEDQYMPIDRMRSRADYYKFSGSQVHSGIFNMEFQVYYTESVKGKNEVPR